MSTRIMAAVLALLVAVAASCTPTVPVRGDDPGRLDALAVAKTVVARADATGEVREARLLTRLVAEGDGQVRIVDPTATAGLRDLDRFGAPPVRASAAVWDLDLDTDEPVYRRTVARVDVADLPVAVSVRASLDGRPVDLEELEGASGQVTLRLLLRNLTAEPRWVEYQTADEAVVEDVEVAVPMVARVHSDFGPAWLDVAATPGTVAVAPERSRVRWTTALFEPLGALEQELEISATLDGGGLPEIVVEAVPVTGVAELDVLRERLIDAQVDAAVTGFGLEEGAEGLDAISVGVAELLEGLAALATGARELGAGAQDAAVGADGLAEGAETSARGAGELADATARTAAGSAALARALDRLSEGVDGIAHGSIELADGLDELASGGDELTAGARELADGAALLAREFDAAVAELSAVADAIPDLDLEPLLVALPLALEVLEAVEALLADPGKVVALLEYVEQRAQEAVTLLEQAREDVDDPAVLDKAIRIVEAIEAAAAEGRAEAAQLTRRLLEGLAELTGRLEAVLDVLATLGELDPGAMIEGIEQLAGAVEELAAGVDQLAVGADRLGQGLALSATGARHLAAGAAPAADGARDAADGADELADGLQELATGGAGLADGLDGLAGGVGELATGLAQLAGGGDELAAGIGDATDGLAALDGGIEQLAEEVIAFLRRAADASGRDLAGELARIEALRERADDGVPYGAPADAAASAAYELRLAAAPTSRIGPAGGLVAGLLLLALAGVVARAATRRSGLEL